MSSEAYYVSEYVPLIKTLFKVYEEFETEEENMVTVIVDSLHKRFDFVKADEIMLLATMVDPRYKDRCIMADKQYAREKLESVTISLSDRVDAVNDVDAAPREREGTPTSNNAGPDFENLFKR